MILDIVVLSKIFICYNLFMNYDLIVYWCDMAILIAYAILILNLWYYVAYFILALKRPKKHSKGKTKYKYCVIIPARNEDKVIRGILNALKKQTYDKDFFKVYVIVESADDPTNNIAKEFGYNVFIRKDLSYKKTKGYAIQELINYLNENQLDDFDSYMIFDADNIMETDYIQKMNDLKNEGNQVGFGYRNFTNLGVNRITQCSAMVFSMLNNIISKGRSIIFKKIMLSGTGYFIDKNIIDDAGGWIFTGMTEDVQVTTYCTFHNVKMGYHEGAQYFDEQPVKFKDLRNQHVRWVWGFLASRKLFKKRKPNYHSQNGFLSAISRVEFSLNILPIVIYLVLCVVSFLIVLALGFSAFYFDPTKVGWLFLHSLVPFSSFYILFIVVAIGIFAFDKRLVLPFKEKFIDVFFFMFFIFEFIWAFFEGLFNRKKRSTWLEINHFGKITNKEIEEKRHGKK